MFAKIDKFLSQAETFFAEHRKLFVGAAALILTVAAQAAPDSQYIQAVVVIAGIFGIHQIPNRPQADPNSKPAA